MLFRRVSSGFFLLLVLLSIPLFNNATFQQSLSKENISFRYYKGFNTNDEIVEWNKTYGGDLARSVQQTNDGGYIIAGITDAHNGDAWLVKTDRYGNLEWNKTYGGTEVDTASSVWQTNDGAYVFAGLTIQHYKYHAWVVRVDAYGNQEWNTTLGGAVESEAHSVQQTSDGGYIIAGDTLFGPNGTDAWLWKTDAYGNLEWNKTYGGNSYDVAYDAQETIDGGYIVCGQTSSFGMTMGDVWLFKTNATGQPQWTYVSGFPDKDAAQSVQQTDDGGYVVAGTRYWTNRYDFWLIKMNSSGSVEWNRAFGCQMKNKHTLFGRRLMADT